MSDGLALWADDCELLLSPSAPIRGLTQLIVLSRLLLQAVEAEGVSFFTLISTKVLFSNYPIIMDKTRIRWLKILSTNIFFLKNISIRSQLL